MNPNFYLRDPKADSETTIFMGVMFRDRTLFKYPTGQKVLPELFDRKEQRAIVSKDKLNEYKDEIPNIRVMQQNINSFLSKMEDDTRSIMDRLLREGRAITPQDLKAQLDELYRPKTEKKTNKLFLKHLEGFIQRCESGEKLHKGKRFGKTTIKAYKSLKSVLADYNSRLTFDDINMDFYKVFMNHLNRQDYKLNSVGKIIKLIKAVMRDALESGLHANTVFTYKQFEVPTESTVEVYLKQAELDALHGLKGLKPNYAIARDLFLVGCYTALRYSDFSRIRKEHIKLIDGVYFLHMITKKTNTKVIIPLKPLVMTILKRYSFSVPHMYEQKLNKHIKEVCKLAKLNDLVEITATIGGQVKTSYKPKYELVKTHTARRTGATLLYLSGEQPIDIAKITGHTNISNLLKYIRPSEEETAMRLANNPYYK